MHLVQVKEVEEFSESFAPLVDAPVDWVTDGDDPVTFGPEAHDLFEEHVRRAANRGKANDGRADAFGAPVVDTPDLEDRADGEAGLSAPRATFEINRTANTVPSPSLPRPRFFDTECCCES